MTVLTLSRLLVAGCIVIVSQLTVCAKAQDTFPMYFGRSISGVFRNLDYEIFYYATVKDVGGPSNQVACVMDKLTGGIFVNMDDTSNARISEMTRDQVEMVIADYYSANPDNAADNSLLSGFSMSYSSGGSLMVPPEVDELAGNSSESSTPAPVAPTLVGSNNGDTAQSRQFFGSDYKPTIYEQYRQESGRDMGDRGAMTWTLEVSLGLYIEGEYLNRFEDLLDLEAFTDKDKEAPQELKELVLQEATSLVLPEVLSEVPDDDTILSSPFYTQELLDLWRGFDMTVSQECVWDLQGELAGENPSLQNTTIIGRSISGEFEGQPYEYSIFFEFYDLKGLGNAQQEKCFADVVNSLFVTTPLIEVIDVDQQDYVRSIIQEEYDAQQVCRQNYTLCVEGPIDTSIFWDVAGGQFSISLGGVTMSYQKGGILTMGGQYIRHYEDYAPNPTGLRTFVKGIQDPIIDADFKTLFPVNGTSQLQDFFLPMMSHGFSDLSFKPKKDGSGIYPILFIENLLYCVNASAVENFKSPYAMPEEVEVEEEVVESQNGEDPNALDAIFVGDLGEEMGPGLTAVEADSTSSGPGNGFCCGGIVISFLLFALF